MSPVISIVSSKLILLSLNNSPKTSSKFKDSLSPGSAIKVISELFPSFKTLPELTFIFLKLSFDSVNSIALKNGTYNFLDFPLIFFTLLSLFLTVKVILKLPSSPITSLGFTFFPLNS